MLKDFLVGIARQNILVDLALNIAETLAYETRMAGICLATAGVGAGLTVCSLVAALVSHGYWSCWLGAGIGMLIAASAGWRLFVAKQRIKALRDAITAKAVRDAASEVLNKSAQLARTGAGHVAQLGTNIAGAGRQATQAGMNAATNIADAGRQVTQAGITAATSLKDSGLEKAGNMKTAATRFLTRKRS